MFQSALPATHGHAQKQQLQDRFAAANGALRSGLVKR
mgnify:CR=1 FL=1